MINIDLKNLEKNIDTLNTLLDEYNEIYVNLFKSIEHTSDFWKDSNAIVFYDKINEEKIKTNEVFKSIKQKANIYKYIYQKYAKFGEKITCNLETKEIMMKKLNYGMEILEVITKQFENLDTSFYFEEKSTLLEQRKNIYKIKQEWTNYHTIIKQFFEQIESIEQEVTKKIAELQEIKIESF